MGRIAREHIRSGRVAAFVVNVTTRGVAPTPPVNVPIAVPPKRTVLPETPIWPAAVPWFLIPNWSLAPAFVVMVSVIVPPIRFAESASVTVELGATTWAPLFSAYGNGPGGSNVTTGAADSKSRCSHTSIWR